MEALLITEADVIFEPDSLRKMVRHLAGPQVGAVTAGGAQLRTRLGGVSFGVFWFCLFLQPVFMIVSSASLLTLYFADFPRAWLRAVDRPADRAAYLVIKLLVVLIVVAVIVVVCTLYFA
jgi:hypothetical protein